MPNEKIQYETMKQCIKCQHNNHVIASKLNWQWLMRPLNCTCAHGISRSALLLHIIAWIVFVDLLWYSKQTYHITYTFPQKINPIHCTQLKHYFWSRTNSTREKKNKNKIIKDADARTATRLNKKI